MPGKPAGFEVWWRAFRFHFVPPSFLPAILGGVIAWSSTGRFHPLYFILTVTGVTINHVALNMTDDYYDYLSCADSEGNGSDSLYCGGSGIISHGLIKPQEMLRAFLTGYSITIVIGLYLSTVISWVILAFGLFGMCCAYFYTAPPIRYGYHGLGEISQLINFSFTIGIGSYFVQTRDLSWEAFWAILPLGFMMFSMIIINEIPDIREDERHGKNNLVVLLGIKRAIWLYGGGMASAYCVIAFIPLLGLTSPWTYLSLVTIPLFLKSLHILRRNYRDYLKMSPANLLTVHIHSFTGILLIAAYIIEGATAGRSLFQMLTPSILLALLYLPLANTIFTKKLYDS